MSVARYDLNACIGCRNCITICPMDVFRFDDTASKSVIAYPENCQSCGQCYLNCQGRSLTIVNTTCGYAITNYRATSKVADEAALATETTTVKPAAK